MATSKIEWTESTWNPLTGCSKVSPGCKNCYAERMAKRLQSMGIEKYRNGFKLTLHEEVMAEPITWIKPQHIFVNSMSDLFHKDVPLDFLLRTFDAPCQLASVPSLDQTRRTFAGTRLPNRVASQCLDGGKCRKLKLYSAN